MASPGILSEVYYSFSMPIVSSSMTPPLTGGVIFGLLPSPPSWPLRRPARSCELVTYVTHGSYLLCSNFISCFCPLQIHGGALGRGGSPFNVQNLLFLVAGGSTGIANCGSSLFRHLRLPLQIARFLKDDLIIVYSCRTHLNEGTSPADILGAGSRIHRCMPPVAIHYIILPHSEGSLSVITIYTAAIALILLSQVRDHSSLYLWLRCVRGRASSMTRNGNVHPLPVRSERSLIIRCQQRTLAHFVGS